MMHHLADIQTAPYRAFIRYSPIVRPRSPKFTAPPSTPDVLSWCNQVRPHLQSAQIFEFCEPRVSEPFRSPIQYSESASLLLSTRALLPRLFRSSPFASRSFPSARSIPGIRQPRLTFFPGESLAPTCIDRKEKLRISTFRLFTAASRSSLFASLPVACCQLPFSFFRIPNSPFRIRSSATL